MTDEERRIVQAETRLGAGEARQGVGEDRQTRADRRQGVTDARQDASDVHQGETDDRLDAVEMLARANISAMTEVRGLRRDIAEVDAKRGRDLNLFKGAMGLVLLMLIGVTVVALSNRPILNLIKSTVTPEGEIYRENQERSGLLLQSLVTEQDCRHRRSEMGLAPPPTTIVIKGGQAVSVPKAPCGDLPDSPPGFQSPPQSEPPPPEEADEGTNLVPYALVLAVGATIGVGAAIYRNQKREEPR